MARRRSFDPSQVKVPADERSAQPGSDTLSPSGVNTLVRDALAARLPRTLRVLGEIGEWTRAGSGHLYFSLGDADSELRCVMWRSDAAKLKFEPESGLEAIATGGIDVYLPRGTYQLMVRKLEPRGIGALEIAFRQLKDKLEAEGLFDRSHKRKLPFVPQRVGVVTSPSGAAIRDITHTLARRFPGLEILVFPCRVQGEGAAAEIATAIQRMNTVAERLGGIDVAIVGRGGGSLEDLWAFNEEPVARAIYASRIPIVSAVGHEVDTSISDLVADVRAATPTAAAELIAPLRSELLEAVNLMLARAGNNLKHRFALARSEYARLAASDLLARPLARCSAIRATA
jgi:exodeoxyribonuclease VII large subunit